MLLHFVGGQYKEYYSLWFQIKSESDTFSFSEFHSFHVVPVTPVTTAFTLFCSPLPGKIIQSDYLFIWLSGLSHMEVIVRLHTLPSEVTAFNKNVLSYYYEFSPLHNMQKQKTQKGCATRGKGAIMFQILDDESGFCLKYCLTQRIN